MLKSRKIINVRHGIKEGTTTSFINKQHLSHTNPFVLWEHFSAKDFNQKTLDFHGHSGIEAISYPIAGTILHKDSSKNRHHIQTGDVHIMTSGQGILHKSTTLPHHTISEYFQLWTALPAHNQTEMCKPSSQLISKNDLPLVEDSHSTTKVLIGSYQQHQSPIANNLGLIFLDIIMTSYSNWSFTPPEALTSGFIYLRNGIAYIANNELHPYQMGFFEPKSTPITITTTNQSARFFIACAKPLNQEIITNKQSVHSNMNNMKQGCININNLLTQYEST